MRVISLGIGPGPGNPGITLLLSLLLRHVLLLLLHTRLRTNQDIRIYTSFALVYFNPVLQKYLGTLNLVRP